MQSTNNNNIFNSNANNPFKNNQPSSKNAITKENKEVLKLKEVIISLQIIRKK